MGREERRAGGGSLHSLPPEPPAPPMWALTLPAAVITTAAGHRHRCGSGPLRRLRMLQLRFQPAEEPRVVPPRWPLACREVEASHHHQTPQAPGSSPTTATAPLACSLARKWGWPVELSDDAARGHAHRPAGPPPHSVARRRPEKTDREREREREKRGNAHTLPPATPLRALARYLRPWTTTAAASSHSPSRSPSAPSSSPATCLPRCPSALPAGPSPRCRPVLRQYCAAGASVAAPPVALPAAARSAGRVPPPTRSSSPAAASWASWVAASGGARTLLLPHRPSSAACPQLLPPPPPRHLSSPSPQPRRLHLHRIGEKRERDEEGEKRGREMSWRSDRWGPR